MKKTALVVLAAGMGSRFGSLKQVEPFGKNGEAILDFSINDAIEAGFSEIVFLIKKEIEAEFKEKVAKKWEGVIPIKYAYQELSDTPIKVDAKREKPWGTGQAVYALRNVVDSPFCVINADDYYGKEGFKIICEHLKTSDEFALSGYMLENTLSDKGSVSRGILTIKDGYLDSVVEDTEIYKENDYPTGTLVSMNMFGMTPKVFEFLEEYFIEFLTEFGSEPKKEFYIPSVIDRGIKEGKIKVKVYKTSDKWYGVTYKDDAPIVRETLQGFQEAGLYPNLK